MHTLQVNSVLDLISLPIDDFVAEAYRLLLGRRPGELERTERVGALRAGLGRVRFLADMGQSQEYRQCHERMLQTGNDDEVIHALFHIYLNRAPDSDGLQHYGGLLKMGRGRAHVARDIARSPEASCARTFRFELENLITIDQAERHWLRRWFGHNKRQGRLHNLEHEVLLQHNLLHSTVPQILPEEKVTHPKPSPHVPDNAAYLHMDTRNQGYDARRIISRLQQAAGTC